MRHAHVFPLILVLLTLNGCSAFQKSSLLASPESTKQLYEGLFRSINVAEKIFRTNLTYCKNRDHEYGFSHASINQNTASENHVLLSNLLYLNDQGIPTVIAIIKAGAAERAGLHVGDLIITVDGKHWTKTGTDQFLEDLRSIRESQSTLHLIVRRNGVDVSISMQPDESCNVLIHFNPNNETSASSGENYIVVESGLNKLLETDDELAFVVAHEFAHIILEHLALPKETFKSKRAIIEQEADELGIRLMIRAGYDPKGAIIAIKKMDASSRGPIAKMLGLFGEYMPTEQRVEFLRNVAVKAADVEWIQ
jgi:hypothetical protein